LHDPKVFPARSLGDGERTGAFMNRPKGPRSAPTKTDQTYFPRDLAERFREWQRLCKQVRDLEEKLGLTDSQSVETCNPEFEKRRK
jgi:hypothetical protein